eukprot:TRINITY_DN30069_c0_g3_i1.p1 TRINITY_DN30069_c0_g3~~TRINITY_DN30069_c0_g3_i1.p1  ORF type:complete len:586 (-),score=94.60 TRINITY_DN30069_c0_g3_i1:330-1988(-)
MEQLYNPDHVSRVLEQPNKPEHVAMPPHAGDSGDTAHAEPIAESFFGKIVEEAKFAELEACIAQHRAELRQLLASVVAASAPTAQDADHVSRTVAGSYLRKTIEKPIRSTWDMSEAADIDRAQQEDVVRASEPSGQQFTVNVDVGGGAWLKVQKWCTRMVRNKWFDRVFVSLIFVNFTFLLAEIQYGAENVTTEIPDIFSVAQNFCTLAFVGELLIRLGCGSSFCSMIDRPWNIFDLLIVTCSVVDWVMGNVSSSADSAALSNVRVVRIVRIARVIRIVRHLRDLRKMIYSILQALSAVFWSAVLMFMVILLFSACLTQAVTQDAVDKPGRNEVSQERLQFYFGTISKSCLTLFESISGGLSWADPMEHLLYLPPLYPVLFIFYIAICVFSLLNLITGIFCERVFEAAESDREQVILEQLMRKDKFVKEFQEVYDSMDANGSGDLSLQELDSQLENERLQAYFGHLNISVARAWDIFKLLDVDSSGTVTIEEFVEGLVRLRGPAKVTDIEQVHYSMKKLMGTLTDFMTLVDEELLGIKLHLGVSVPTRDATK